MSMVLNERAPSGARKARQEFAAAVSEVQALTKPSTPLETQQRHLIDLLIAQVSANDKGFADEVADLDKRGRMALEHLARRDALAVSLATAKEAIAAAEAEEERHEEETLNRKRKALAAMLRAGDLARKLVLTPSDFARRIFSKNTKTPIEMPSFPEPSEMDLEIHAKHSRVLYNFVRKGTDLEGFKKCLRDLQNTYHGSQTKGETTYAQPFRCSNRFGESLMHLACRRGRTEMVRFLVEELPGGNPSQMLSIKDDCHKTPLHDACWTPDPNFELVELILEHAPEQVLMQDVRGNTPFDYVRKEDHGLWLRFLWERRSLLVAKRPKAPATEPPQIPTELIV